MAIRDFALGVAVGATVVGLVLTAWPSTEAAVEVPAGPRADSTDFAARFDALHGELASIRRALELKPASRTPPSVVEPAVVAAERSQVTPSSPTPSTAVEAVDWIAPMRLQSQATVLKRFGRPNEMWATKEGGKTFWAYTRDWGAQQNFAFAFQEGHVVEMRVD